MFLQLLLQNLIDSTSLSLSIPKIRFSGETSDPDFSFDSLLKLSPKNIIDISSDRVSRVNTDKNFRVAGYEQNNRKERTHTSIVKYKPVS